MIRGFDISHWQGARGVAQGLKAVPDAKFVIIKATEGRTYVDKRLESNYSDAVSSGLMVGFYHYARPENGNSPMQEASHFVETIKSHIGTSVLVLDWEGNALKYGVEWAREWLNAVYSLTGVKPIIYLSGSEVKNYTDLYNSDYGLWVASWGSTSPDKWVKGWNTWALWQYTNEPIDCDQFNGSVGQFMMYAAVDDEWVEYSGAEPETQAPAHCGCCCRKE